jgi:hypothetical protein
VYRVGIVVGVPERSFMVSPTRHCEERSDEAIQNRATRWIASLRSQ